MRDAGASALASNAALRPPAWQAERNVRRLDQPVNKMNNINDNINIMCIDASV